MGTEIEDSCFLSALVIDGSVLSFLESLKQGKKELRIVLDTTLAEQHHVVY